MAAPVSRALREAVYARDAGRCQRCGRPCLAGAHSLQHRRPRQMGGDRHAHTVANLVLLCGTGTTGCHGHVESHRTEGYADGFLVHRWDDPATTPVRRFRRTWALPGDAWTPCPDPTPEEG